MNKFECKYCSKPMHVSFLEYKSNSFCNECFDERSAITSTNEEQYNTFHFMGESFDINTDDNLKGHPIESSIP